MKTWTCEQLLIYTYQVLFKNLACSSDFITYLKNDVSVEIEYEGEKELITVTISRIEEMQNLRYDIAYWLKNNYDFEVAGLKKEMKEYREFTNKYDKYRIPYSSTKTWTCKAVIIETSHLLIQAVSASLGVIDYLLLDEFELTDKKPLLHFRSKLKIMKELCHDIQICHCWK